MSITRQERERAVLDLYHNQGKTIRDIAKEARMSFRDIGAILNKASEEKEAQQRKEQQQEHQQLSLATQAYKLFSDGKNPMEVAVALNTRESEVTKFYKEYLKLNQMHDLNIIYEKLKGDIIPFLKLYRSAKAAGMSVEHVVNLLRIANNNDGNVNNNNNNTNNNLPAVEHRYNTLKQEVNSLESRKLNSNRTLQDLRKRISTSRKALDACILTHQQQIEKISELQSKKIELEVLVKRFENNNEEYLKINQTVRENVSSILSNAKSLLRLALDSLIESVRNDPAKYSPLVYYCNNNNMSMSSSYMYGGQQQHHYIPSQDYFIEHYTAMLVEEAEKLYNKLVKDLTNRIICDMAFSNNNNNNNNQSSSLLSSSTLKSNLQKDKKRN
jgi:transposase